MSSELMNQLDVLKKEAKEILEKEKVETSFDKIQKPSELDSILGFDYSNIDDLTMEALRKHSVVISQYMVYLNKYVNQLSILVNITTQHLENALDSEAIKVDCKEYKSMKEKYAKVREEKPDIIELENELRKEKIRLELYKNSIETFTQHLQTVKKAYDGRQNEKLSPQ